jgi:hypothetical protein
LSLSGDPKYPAERFAVEEEVTKHLTRADWQYDELLGKYPMLGEMDLINTR